jgi:hypothetical protein
MKLKNAAALFARKGLSIRSSDSSSTFEIRRKWMAFYWIFHRRRMAVCDPYHRGEKQTNKMNEPAEKVRSEPRPLKGAF